LVARLNASLTTLEQATYLGGNSLDYTGDLAIHATTGDVYVTGATLSTDFPGTAGGAQSAMGGGDRDAFVARLNTGLTTLEQATYLGGNDLDFIASVAIHPTTGEVYVVGFTGSTDFPKTTGGAQCAGGPGADAFVARLNPGLTTLEQATYLGGSGSEFMESSSDLAIHPTTGEVYVAGRTDSTDFPGTTSGAQSTNGGANDAFIAVLSADLAGPPMCGNGCVEPGEECDDGNTLDGDCCSSSCQFEAPLLGCATPGKSLLLIKDQNQDGAGPKDKLVWKWLKGPTMMQVDFGDPTVSAQYRFCIYAGTAQALALEATAMPGGTCAGVPCWKKISTKGYKRKDSAAATAGISLILLKGGAAGSAKIIVKGKDGNLGLTPPTLLLDTAADVIVQLSNSDNTNCWQGTFPPGSVKKNTDTQFNAKTP
jgi:cysteine-rich repeat protein